NLSRVYLVKDQNLNDKLRAVKEILLNQSETFQIQKAFESFEKEFTKAAQLDHRAIASVYDYFSFNKRFYFVMKYVEGRDLHSHLVEKRNHYFDEKTVTEWAIQIADLFVYFHSLPSSELGGTLHPAHLIVDKENRITFVNFGIGSSLHYQPRYYVPDLLSPEQMCYSSPESIVGNVVAQSDIYNLGALMFHLLTGVNPIDNPLLIFDFTKSLRPSQINRYLSPAIEAIICKAVSLKAEDRHTSAQQMKSELEAHLALLNRSKEPKPAFLVFVDPINNVSFTITQEKTVIGRSNKNSVDIDLDLYDKDHVVSRRHAIIYRESDQFFVEDTNSTGGTFVNRARISTNQRYLIKHNDLIRLSEITFRFIAPPPPFKLTLERQKIDAESFFERGEELRRTAKFVEAIEAYSEAIKLKPATARFYYYRGYVYAENNQLELAILDFTEAIKLQPDYPVAYNSRAFAYISKGKLDLALADFNKLVELQPNNEVPYQNRGFVYDIKGKLDLALTDYSQAIKIAPNHAGTYYDRASIYVRKAEFDLAFTDYSKAVEIKPDYAKAFRRRGNLFYRRGDIERAISDLDRSIRLNSEDPESYFVRGDIHDFLGDIQRACEDYYKGYRLRGEGYFKKERYEAAISDFSQAIKFSPSDPTVYVKRAEVSVKKGYIKRAISDYKKALELTQELEKKAEIEKLLTELENLES
ncbi:MAG: tetratricopeptide repeat protein, partial [Blastocatellia bacterium]|nr:tetratricopeptide repeat protein [Blastocatellia bacterium]